MKCQSFEGSHFARDCKRTDDTCGTCTGNHRTKDCESTSLDQHWCANCQEVGHAAWDRECPVYLEKARQYQSHIADARYRFYPEREDPTTWELDADTNHQWTPTDQQDNCPQDRQLEDYIEERWETAGHRQKQPAIPCKPQPFPMGPPDSSQTQLPDTWTCPDNQPTQGS